MPDRYLPKSTYRLQFTSDFTFEDATRLVPYFARLGISHLYCSPIFEARQGSTHGYDIVDPLRISSALGGEEGFTRLARRAGEHGLGILLDIVPNHMAADPANPWWMEVLRHGPSSEYSRVFDIRWEGEPGTAPRVVLPFLGKPLDEVLSSGEIRAVTGAAGIELSYFDWRFPVEPGSLREVLGELGREPSPDPLLLALRERVGALPPYFATSESDLLRRRALAREIDSLWREGAQKGETVTARICERLNRQGSPALPTLIDRQPYRLGFWKQASRELNYRRFFDITHLVGVRVEDPGVFSLTHDLIFRLVKSGAIQGVRVDHIDGLYDPGGYLRRLSEHLDALVSRPVYLVVEKILEEKEPLNRRWPIQGTTGYGFLNRTLSFQVDPQGFSLLQSAYDTETGQKEAFWDRLREIKEWMITGNFAAEWKGLTGSLHAVASRDSALETCDTGLLDGALLELSARLPVYRTYLSEGHGRDLLGHCTRQIGPPERRACAETLAQRLMAEYPTDLDPEVRAHWEDLTHRWEQFTGPIMAKSLEDTALYRYFPLASLNEVGGVPVLYEVDREDLHQYFTRRRRDWPLAMSAASTHDTKRSEDVRARIAVLSEVPDRWVETVRGWRGKNAAFRQGESDVPDFGVEWLIYQTLLGIWPMEAEPDRQALKHRLREYLTKVLREAKEHSNWIDPDTSYEERVCAFADRLLEAPEGDSFRREFEAIHRTVAFGGCLNSLSALVLRLCAPGVPDVYQGQEIWDLSLVDPDNRRPVDFTARAAMLEKVSGKPEGSGDEALTRALRHWEDGRLKMTLLTRLLHLRNHAPELFLRGEYLPLAVEGDLRECAFAFARREEERWAVVVVSRFLTRQGVDPERGYEGSFWGSDEARLPESAPRIWYPLWGTEGVSGEGPSGTQLRLSRILHPLPVAVLTNFRTPE